MAGTAVSKEVAEKVFDAIESAKKSGKLRKGTNEVTKSVEKAQAILVAIAKDASPPEIVMHLPVLCKEKGIPCIEVSTKEELGVAAGIGVPTASVAIVKEGDAKNLIKEIKAALK